MPDEPLPVSQLKILVSRFTDSGQWDRGLATARQWLEAEPESAKAHMYAGWCLLSLSRHDEGLAHAKQYLAAAPLEDYAHRLTGLLLYKKGRVPEGNELLERAIELNPRQGLNWYQRALSYYGEYNGKCDLENARRCALKARELLPREPCIAYLFALFEPPRSQARYERVLETLELSPEEPYYLNQMGLIHLNVRKDYAAAEACFQSTVALSPAWAEYRNNLRLAMMQGDALYHKLSWPRRWLESFWGKEDLAIWATAPGSWRRWRGARFLALVPTPAVALAAVVCLPMLGFHGFFMEGELRARMGERGTLQNSFLDHRLWSLRSRWLVFAALTVLGFTFLVVRWQNANEPMTPATSGWMLAGIFSVLLLSLCWDSARGNFVFTRKQFVTAWKQANQRSAPGW